MAEMVTTKIRVVSPAGRPLPNHVVSMSARGMVYFSDLPEATSDPNGVAEFKDQLPAGRIYVDGDLKLEGLDIHTSGGFITVTIEE